MFTVNRGENNQGDERSKRQDTRGTSTGQEPGLRTVVVEGSELVNISPVPSVKLQQDFSTGFWIITSQTGDRGKKLSLSLTVHLVLFI